MPSPNEILFHELQQFIEEFQHFLEGKYSQPTMTKHIMVCNMLNEYLQERELNGFEDITGAHCGSRFVQYFNNHTAEGLASITVKNILSGFFTFIHDQHRISNNSLKNYFKG